MCDLRNRSNISEPVATLNAVAQAYEKRTPCPFVLVSENPAPENARVLGLIRGTYDPEFPTTNGIGDRAREMGGNLVASLRCTELEAPPSGDDAEGDESEFHSANRKNVDNCSGVAATDPSRATFSKHGQPQPE